MLFNIYTFAKLINSLDLLPSYQEGVGEVDEPSPPPPLPLGKGSF